jgi:radical SAM protein with 4Fe4S-binding SPASM domain
MCAITNEDDYIYGNLDESKFNNLKDSLPNISIVSLNGHGESLMHPHFLSIMTEMGGKVPHLELTTNGLLITDDVAKSLVLCGLTELTISIHSAESAMYSEITKNGSLDTLINNITNINKYKKLYDSASPVLTFQFVSMRRNISQLKKLLTLAHQLRVRKLVILKLLEYELVHGESLDRNPELVRTYFPPAMKYAQELGIELVVPSDYIQMLVSEYVPEPNKMSSPDTEYAGDEIPGKVRNCLDPWMTSFITIDGEVYPCCNIRESVGSLKDNSFEAIWFGEKLSRLQKSILSGNPPKQCLTCTQRGFTNLTTLKLKVVLRRLARQPVLNQIYSILTSRRLFRRFRR